MATQPTQPKLIDQPEHPKEAPRIEEPDEGRGGAMDAELLTLRRIIALFEKLPDSDAKTRVIRYLFDRYDMGS